MQLRELKILVRQGEGDRLEFKRKADHPDKIMREVGAFANSKGGILLVGVSDNGEILGVKHPEEEIFVLEEALKKHFEGKVDYRMSQVPIPPSKSVLVYEIIENNQKPVYCLYNFKRKTGKAYIRLGEESLQASYEMRQILKGDSRLSGVHFTFGEWEAKLLGYLGEVGESDVQAFAARYELPIKQASGLFVTLTLAKVIEILPQSQGDRYRLLPIGRA